MTLFSEKVLTSNRCISGLMSNLIKESWTDSKANVCWRNAKPTMNYDRYSIKDDCEINFLPHFPPKSFCQIARQSLTRKISTNLKGVVRIMEQNPIWSYKYVYYIILYIYLSFYVMRLHKVLLFSKLTFSYLSCKEKKTDAIGERLWTHSWK